MPGRVACATGREAVDVEGTEQRADCDERRSSDGYAGLDERPDHCSCAGDCLRFISRELGGCTSLVAYTKYHHKSPAPQDT